MFYFFKKIPLHMGLFLGLILGCVYGYLLPDYVNYVAPLGELFLRILKLLVVPLIFVSIVDGINQAGSFDKLSKLGGKTFFYYMLTTALAVLTSLLVVNWIKPGVGVQVFGKSPEILETASIHFMDFIPSNIFSAFSEAQSLQIILIAIIFGIGMVSVSEHVQGLKALVKEANFLIMKIVAVVIAFAPIGIFGLIAKMVGTFDWSAALGILKFALTIMVSLSLHALITLPIFFKIFSGRSLTTFVRNVYPSLVSAFSTASSSATLPISLDCIQNKEKISKEVSSFVLPIGATVNMDGTAMYESVACLFIAQALGIELSLSSQLVVFFTATLAAVGAASIPSAGLITLAIVLSAVNLPLEGIGFLLAFDRPLDMCRTTVNVWGDMIGCAVVQGKENSKNNS